MGLEDQLLAKGPKASKGGPPKMQSRKDSGRGAVVLEDTVNMLVALRAFLFCVQSTPKKNGHADDALRSPEFLQEFFKSGPKREFLLTCSEMKNFGLLKTKVRDLQRTTKLTKKEESIFLPNTLGQPSSTKQHRKAENPTRRHAVADQPPDFVYPSSWICKNSACRAVLSTDNTFCKRCSCCICHLFDDNKDPTLWLECSTEADRGDSCGICCHIECALQHKKVGVVDFGQLMQLDGSYCCASCGKVSGILGCWKKQLIIARDARRLDVLCYRIYLSHRLLDGTLRFEELQEVIKDAKAKLETEVGPLNGNSVKMARGIVSRLPVAGEVQKLCTLAIEKADKWLASVSNVNPRSREYSLPAACKFLFEEITSSSIVIILIEPSGAFSYEIKGYKLWYNKAREETNAREGGPVSVFPRTQRRILISNLLPCTEYAFRILSYTDEGDLGHSEARCFTRSVEIIRNTPKSTVPLNCKKIYPTTEEISCSKRETNYTAVVTSSVDFKVRDLGKILRHALAKEEVLVDRLCTADTDKCCENGVSKADEPEWEEQQFPSVSRELDLNVASVPDLNEELTPPFNPSRDEDDECPLHQAVEPDVDVVSTDIQKPSSKRSNARNGSKTCTFGLSREVPAIDSHLKRTSSTMEEIHDCDSTLINGSLIQKSNGSLFFDENFEYCVKIIRWLECEGHIKQEFRLKLLTWFSLRSTEQERRVFFTYIQTLVNDPQSLAGQLVDSFSDLISCKKPRNGFWSNT